MSKSKTKILNQLLEKLENTESFSIPSVVDFGDGIANLYGLTFNQQMFSHLKAKWGRLADVTTSFGWANMNAQQFKWFKVQARIYFSEKQVSGVL